MSEKKQQYLREILETVRTVGKGLRLSLKHMKRGIRPEPARGIQEPGYFGPKQGPITIQYPKDKVPVPDTGRYRLHMETEDCIACDKCARICPVDCITIESFRADGDLGRTSDGTIKRLHLPTFDIDMGKCMYCGLCTTVCPTECLTMSKVYDFSEFDRDNLIYHFGAMSPAEEVTVREETEAALAKKKAEKAAQAESKPKRKPVIGAKSTASDSTETTFVPKKKPIIKRKPKTEDESEEASEKKTFAPRRKPVMKPKTEGEAEEKTTDSGEEKPKSFTPRRKPVMKKPAPESEEEKEKSVPEGEEKPKFKPRRKPVMKKPAEENDSETENTAEEASPEKKKFTPRRKPIMKKKPDEDTENDDN